MQYVCNRGTLMALKIVQLIAAVAPPNNGISTSVAINLKTGYIRLTSSGGGNHIAINTGNNPSGVNSESSFLISENTSEILKERVARQQIVGITTGTSTVINFGENLGNPFIIGDAVSIINAQPSGINTQYNLVTATTDSSITISYNSSSVVGVITTRNATVCRSVKISAIGEINGTHLHIAEVQITSQA